MKYGLAVPLAVAAALLALYASFVDAFVGKNLLAGATALELGIFFLQLAKVVAMVSIKRLRNSPTVTLIDLLGAELVVLLPGLVICYFYLGVTSAPSLMVQVLQAWIAGAATFATPFAVYRLTKAMVRGEVLLAVLPSAIFLSELMILLIAGANASGVSGLGLAGLARAMLLVGAGVRVAGAQVAGVTALPPLIVLYVSLLLHSISRGGSWARGSFRGPAALAVLATGVTCAAAYAASFSAVSLTYVVLPPVLLSAGLLWWLTREV